MKGTINKKGSGWIVSWLDKNQLLVLPLHHIDVNKIEADKKIFDNVEARILANPEVEFYISGWCHCTNGVGARHDAVCGSCKRYKDYAKLKK